jgi:hypothetical protein
MGNASVSFGVRCNKCGGSAGTVVMVGGATSAARCVCGGEFVPDAQWTNLANVKCSCGFSSGKLVSNGPANCPICGTPL